MGVQKEGFLKSVKVPLQGRGLPQRPLPRDGLSKADCVNLQTPGKTVLPKSEFLHRLQIEKQRVETSRVPMSMALFSFRGVEMNSGGPVSKLLKSLNEHTRETDVKGWVDHEIIGLLLPDTDARGLKECIKKVANGNRSLPYSVVTATYPDPIFEIILSTSDSRPGGGIKFYPRKYLRRRIREEKIRTCRTGRAFSLALFKPSEFASRVDRGNTRLIETVIKQADQELHETTIFGQWDKKTVAILLLDTMPEATFALIDKLISRIKANGYRVVGSSGKEIFKVFAFPRNNRGLKPGSGNGKGGALKARDRKVGDLSTFHNLESHHEVIKRIADIVLSSTFLALLAPFFLLFALLIKIDSPGPVFYRQIRIGKGGRPFTFLKFRSMRHNADDTIHREHVKHLMNGESGLSRTGHLSEKSYKLTEDDRVSRFGKFLRKTSIDELPQLFNVLRGEMTFVGPRPHPVYEAELYNSWHSFRLNLKPGITGLGQVCGRFNTNYEDVYRLDLQYFKSASLLLDLKILCRTMSIVFSGRGAY